MRDKISETVKKSFGYEQKDDIEENTLYEIGMDSLDVVVAVMDVEKEFSVLIPDEHIENFTRDTKVKDLIDVLTNLVENKNK